MANKFFKPGVQRASKVQDLFAAIAPRYDIINDLQSFGLHRYWKRKMVAKANPVRGERALDVCCGTGDISFLLGSKGAEVTGLDFSEPMLRVATDKLTRNPPPGLKPRFIQGDAQALPFEDQSFEIVTVGYGLRNLTDWQTGLREMWRVAKPGGRLLVLDFGKPDNPIWRKLYFSYLKLFVPAFGRIFCGDSDTHSYILESLTHYPAQNGVAAEMSSLGCEKVEIIHLLGGVMTINYGIRAQASI